MARLLISWEYYLVVNQNWKPTGPKRVAPSQNLGRYTPQKILKSTKKSKIKTSVQQETMSRGSLKEAESSLSRVVGEYKVEEWGPSAGVTIKSAFWLQNCSDVMLPLENIHGIRYM
jgi:hypothetical protein